MSLFPNYLLHEYTLDNKPAAFGFLYFYNSGTLTPKTVYADAACTTPLTNPVQLDSSGTAVIFMGPGAYRVWLKDKNDAQIVPWVDGIVGDGSGAGIDSNATYSSVKTYNDLRALQNDPDFVYVCGRLVDGDGGEGLFQKIQTTTTDDDGIILNRSSGSISYKRVFDAVINPLWYGVKYNVAVDNKINWDKVSVAAGVYNFPVMIAGPIYINQNFTIPSYVELQFNDDGYFYAGLSVTCTFSTNSDISSYGKCFGTNVQPRFNLNTVQTIKLSWMGGSVSDEQFTKLLNSAITSRSTLEIDTDISISTTTIYSVNPIIVTNRSVITLTGTVFDITLFGLVADREQIFYFPNLTSGLFNFGSQFVKPEIFGATGVVSYNAWKEVYIALMTGKCYLTTGQSYSVQTALPSIPSIVEIIGGGLLDLKTSVVLNTTNLILRDLTLTKTPTSASWGTINNLEMYNCVVPSIYSPNIQVVDGVTYSDLPTNPSYAGNPSLYNAHLPLLPLAPNLKTDVNGKIYSDYSFPNGLTNWNVEYGIYTQNAQWLLGTFGSDNTNIFINSVLSTTNKVYIKPIIGGTFGEATFTTPSQLVTGYSWYIHGFKYVNGKYYAFASGYNATTTMRRIVMSSTDLLNGPWTTEYATGYDTNTNDRFDTIVQSNDGTIYASINHQQTIVKVSPTGVVTTFTYTNRAACKVCWVDPNNSNNLLAITYSALVSIFATGVAKSTNGGSSWTDYTTSDVVWDACAIEDMNNIIMASQLSNVSKLTRFTNFPSSPSSVYFDSYGVADSGRIITSIDYFNGVVIGSGLQCSTYASFNGGWNFTRKYQGGFTAPSQEGNVPPAFYVPSIKKLYVGLGYQQIISGE